MIAALILGITLAAGGALIFAALCLPSQVQGSRPMCRCANCRRIRFAHEGRQVPGSFYRWMCNACLSQTKAEAA